MASKVFTQPGTRKLSHPGHGKRHCLKILQKLSLYLDDELSGEVCAEIRAHLGACPNCEVFLDSLRQTITLCRHAQPYTLSSSDRAILRRQILKSVVSA
jgi:hypothetical protein